MADKMARSGEPADFASDLAKGFALLTVALLRTSPEAPEKNALEDVLRRMRNHVDALDRTDLRTHIDEAWQMARQ